jgi:trans-aconitate methyltransferase
VPDAQDRYIGELIAPFGPTRPVHELVVELNRILFNSTASYYESLHPEVVKQLPPVWKEMLAIVRRELSPPWRLMDFGCGTGFASSQAMQELGSQNIETLTCCDISPNMLEQCRQKIAPMHPRAEYVTSLPEQPRRYNLLVTNAVMHHVPCMKSFLNTMEPLLEPGSWWVAGHEPSARYYRIAECRDAYQATLKAHRWNRFLSPSKYWTHAKQTFTSGPNTLTAKRSLELGLFKKLPSDAVVDRLVDYGVAHCLEEVEVGRGFDFEQLKVDLKGRWDLVSVRTYSFMGNFYEGMLSSHWRSVASELAKKYPKDGAMYSSVWRRCS